jgi:hypothetical protein
MDFDVETDGSKRLLSFGEAARETNRDHVHQQVETASRRSDEQRGAVGRVAVCR